MTRSSSPAARRARAAESYGNVADCLGPRWRGEGDAPVGSIGRGTSVFAITRGQWSMIDAVLHLIDCCDARVDLSIWTWTVAEYEVAILTRLRLDDRIRTGRLVIDEGARAKNRTIIADWQGTFGPDSVRYVINHAKLARIWTPDLRFLARGSMNLNANNRFEQFDLTEGGADFDLVTEIEDALPALPDSCPASDARAASKVTQQAPIPGLDLKRWAK